MQEAIFGGLIGAFAAIGANWLSGRLQANLEREKWQRGLEESFKSEVRKVVLDLANELAKASHSMLWLTWLADRGPAKVTQEHLDNYDAEMHAILPRIVGLHAILSGMDRKLHQELYPVVEMAYKIDGAIGKAGLLFVAGQVESVKPLGEQMAAAQQLVGDLNTKLSQALKPYAQTTAAA